MTSAATFSACRSWRYDLWRSWRTGMRYAMFIGLNPSTADETNDDPTIRRCIGFAQAWGYDALCMTNLFAFRATDPKVMKATVDPVGPANDATLLRLAGSASIVVAAWGAHGGHLGRDGVVKAMLTRHGVPLHYLKLTAQGYPGHPLYLRGDTKPTRWTT